MLEARIGDDVDDIGAVAKLSKFFQREEAHAGEIGFHAQHAVELDGMADGLVDLQPQLRATQDDRAFPLRTLRGLVQRHGLLANAPRVLHQLPLLEQLVSLQLMLAASE